MANISAAEDDNPLALSPQDLADISAQQIILASAHHEIETLRSLLRSSPSTGAEAANVKDPETGYTPLHAAIAGMSEENRKGQRRLEGTAANGDVHVNGADPDANGAGDAHETGADTDDDMERAVETVQVLFQNGAIWNELDSDGETPGCLAWRLGLKRLYEMVVDAGVRAELLFQRLDGYEPLGGGEDEDEDGDGDVDVVDGAAELKPQTVDEVGMHGDALNDAAREVPSLVVQSPDSDETGEQAQMTEVEEEDISTSRYLSSRLTFTKDRLLDDQGNAVMMEWESEIMQKTTSALIPSIDGTIQNEPLVVLNIGYGMGVFDSFIQQLNTPHGHIQHHIIEAHQSVLEQIRSPSGFLDTHQANRASITIHEGRWQDILPKLAEQGLVFDVIFFDTFAEEYSAFRTFFEEWVIALLKEDGRWSFFHGLGADRRVCYDVYTKVVEMDLFEAGFDVEWEKVGVPDLLQKGEWRGVKRPYWALDEYRLPVCTFVGR